MTQFDDPGLFGARSVAISPNDKHVHVASPFDDTAAVFGRPYDVYLPLAVRSH